MNIAKLVQPNRYYATVLLFATSSPSPNYSPLYEEEIVLIEALSEAEARVKAVEYAKEQEGTYSNERQEMITNTFEKLVDIQLMQPDLEHGSTLYARHFRDYSAYEAFEPLLAGKGL